MRRQTLSFFALALAMPMFPLHAQVAPRQDLVASLVQEWNRIAKLVDQLVDNNSAAHLRTSVTRANGLVKDLRPALGDRVDALLLPQLEDTGSVLRECRPRADNRRVISALARTVM